jgi:Cysteine dioxygenase type I
MNDTAASPSVRQGRSSNGLPSPARTPHNAPALRVARSATLWMRPDTDLERLEVLAAGLAPAAAQRPLPKIEQTRTRAYCRLVTTPSYEAWLIVWSPSATLELHDHGGSLGALFLAQGELVETYSDLIERHRLRARVIEEGHTLAVPAHRVHEVCNLAATDAVSIHVYSPPLTEMTFFDHRAESFLTPLKTERSETHQLLGDAA